MPHYHVRVRDAARGGFAPPTLPKVKPPRTTPAKAPRSPKAKAPTVPKPPTPGGGGGKPPAPGGPSPTPGAGGKSQTPLGHAALSAGSAIHGVNRALGAGTRLAHAGERGVNRLAGWAEMGEGLNKDSGMRDQMGHYHFNIPTRGSKMSQDYGTSEGAQKRNSTQSHADQANLHKQAAAKHAQAGHHQAVKAHNAAAQAHGVAWRNPSIGNSQYAWGMTQRASQVRDQGYSTGGGGSALPTAGMSQSSTGGGMSSTGGGAMPSMDTGTSEGAKKAAQTKAQGYGQHPLAKGAGFSIHGTEGTQRQAPQRSEPREEYRGYDSRRRK